MWGAKAANESRRTNHKQWLALQGSGKRRAPAVFHARRKHVCGPRQSVYLNFCWICSTRAFCTLTPLLFPCPACRWRGEAVGSGYGGRIPGGRLERARARYGTRVITPAAACCGRKQARGDLLCVPMPAVDGLLDGRVRNELVGGAAPPPRDHVACSAVLMYSGNRGPHNPSPPSAEL